MTKKTKKSTHYKHQAFQKKLGEHCRKIRTNKGYGVNRLAAESDGMSPDAVIRLEKGGTVTTATLYRYAEVLGIKVKDLFDFPFSYLD